MENQIVASSCFVVEYFPNDHVFDVRNFIKRRRSPPPTTLQSEPVALCACEFVLVHNTVLVSKWVCLRGRHVMETDIAVFSLVRRFCSVAFLFKFCVSPEVSLKTTTRKRRRAPGQHPAAAEPRVRIPSRRICQPVTLIKQEGVSLPPFPSRSHRRNPFDPLRVLRLCPTRGISLAGWL